MQKTIYLQLSYWSLIYSIGTDNPLLALMWNSTQKTRINVSDQQLSLTVTISSGTSRSMTNVYLSFKDRCSASRRLEAFIKRFRKWKDGIFIMKSGMARFQEKRTITVGSFIILVATKWKFFRLVFNICLDIDNMPEKLFCRW